MRAGVIALGILVVALVLSTVYARWAPRPGPRTSGPHDRVIRVQVLNGSGEAGMGGRVASYLREGGFHVAEVGNADRFDYFETLVVVRRNPAAARAVAHYLGDPPVVLQTWTSDLAEVTVVVGSDRSHLRLE